MLPPLPLESFFALSETMLPASILVGVAAAMAAVVAVLMLLMLVAFITMLLSACTV